MPAPNRNPLLVDIPSFEEEGGNGGGELQFENLEGLPADLQPTYFYQYMQEQFPSALYLAQLKDYWIARLNLIEDPKDRQKMWNKATEMLKQAQDMINFGYPVEVLPEYEFVRKQFGSNMVRAYERYVREFTEEQAALEKERREVRESLLGPLDKRYGSQMGGAIRAGLISEQEAEVMRRGLTRQALGQEGIAESKQGRRALKAGVEAGDISREEAFGRGTEWEQWQHGEAEQDRMRQAQTWAGDKVGLTAKIREAQEVGLKVDESMYGQILDPRMPAETQGMYLNALQQQITNVKNQRMAEYAGFLIKDYPELYEKWQTIPGVRENLGGAQPTQFLSWLQPDEEGNVNPEWQKAYVTKEAKRWQDYGDIYPSYGKYVRSTGYREAKPFETWMTEDPQAVAWMAEKTKRDELEKARRQRELVGTTGVYRE